MKFVTGSIELEDELRDKRECVLVLDHYRV